MNEVDPGSEEQPAEKSVANVGSSFDRFMLGAIEGPEDPLESPPGLSGEQNEENEDEELNYSSRRW